MTDLGHFLRAWRLKNGRTLKDVAGEGFSQQVLSNYELGTSLPQREVLEKLAHRYKATFAEVESLYFSSLTQIAVGPIAEEPFLDSLLSIGRGDHLVVVTQRPLVAERPELAANIIRLLEAGACFTYVAYIPESAPSTDITGSASGGVPNAVDHWDNRWESNHHFAAQILRRELRKSTTVSNSSERLNYLLIGEPNKNDLSFLRAYGATLYICRPQDSQYRESQSFSEMRAPDGQHWWHPYDPGFQLALHDWLVFSCGLDLATSKSEFPPGPEARNLRKKTLDEFLKVP